MGFSVREKVCLVTGSGRGLGKEIARRLLKEGAKAVCISDINSVTGTDTAEELKNQYPGGRVTFFQLDVTKVDQWKEIYEHCENVFKAPVDILVNNAGIAVGKGVQVIDVNLMGVVHGSTQFLNRYGKSKGGQGGRIINIASSAGLVNGLSFEKHQQYHASKFGVVSYSRHFGDSHPSDNPWNVDRVKCYAICPWFVDTAMIRDPTTTPGQQEALDGLLAKMRALKPWEVVDVCINSLEDDANGSIRIVFPGIPAMKMPNFNPGLLILTFLAARVYAKFSPLTKHVEAYHLLSLVALFIAFLSFLSGNFFSWYFL